MVATHVFVHESESVIVMTGREVWTQAALGSWRLRFVVSSRPIVLYSASSRPGGSVVEMTCRLRTGLLNNDESHHDIYRLYQMDSTLAGLMTCESAVAPSESGAAPKETDTECLLRIRSVSQAGSVRSDDADDLAPALDDALRERPSL